VTLPAWLRVPSWALIGAGAALTAVVIRRDGEMAERDRVIERQASDALARGARYRATVASLRRMEGAALADAQKHARAAGTALSRADSLQREADRLARIADSLRAAQTASGQPDPCAPANAALTSCQLVGRELRASLAEEQAAGVALEVARRTASERADTAERRASGLDSSLRALLTVRTCRMLGLVPCPSRKLALVAGLIGGLLLAPKLP